MKDKRHTQSFNERQENLNISDVGDSINLTYPDAFDSWVWVFR